MVQRRKGEHREWNELLKAAGWRRGTACAPGRIVLMSEVPSEEICEVSAKVSSCPSIKEKDLPWISVTHVGHKSQILTRAVLWASCSFTSSLALCSGLGGSSIWERKRADLTYHIAFLIIPWASKSASDVIWGREDILNCLWFLHWLGQTYVIFMLGYICLQCGRPRFDTWVRKIPWRRKWQPTPVFLPGESHGWRNLVGYSPWGRKERLSDFTFTLF